MNKFLKTALALLALTVFSILPIAHAATTNNAQSILQYFDGPEGGPAAGSTFHAGTSNGQWWALRGQPTKTFHRITVRDDGGCVIALGHGTSPNQVVDLYIGGSGGASTHLQEYSWGLSYGGSSSSLWWKRVECEPISGKQVINFIY